MRAQTETMASEESSPTQKDWRLIGVLLLLVAFGLLALVPYGLTVAGQEMNMETLSTLPLQFISQIILYGILVWIGL